MRKDKCVSSDGSVKHGWNIDLSQHPPAHHGAIIQHMVQVNYSNTWQAYRDATIRHPGGPELENLSRHIILQSIIRAI